MRTLLMLIVVLMTQALEAAELTPEQKLAALVFTEVQSVDITPLVAVEVPSQDYPQIDVFTRAAAIPRTSVPQKNMAALLAMIASAENYRFDDTTMCFDPGLQIRVNVPDGRIRLNVCLSCAKMSVTSKDRHFMIDFSDKGLTAYKLAYLHLVVLKKAGPGQ